MLSNKHKALSRRGFLRGALATGAAVTLPLPKLAWANDAVPTDIPTKFGLWFFGNGIDPPKWHPAGGGGVGNAWQLTEQLAPLAPYKALMSVLTGWEVKTGGAHVGGAAGTLTGAPPDLFGSAQLPSIDQIIAKQLEAAAVARGDGPRPFRSLEVGLSKATPAGSETLLHAVSHSGPAAPLYPEYDPHTLFARLFGAGATSPELRQAKRSVLDVVLADFKGLRASMGSADKARLDVHADAIRALEKRLDALPNQNALCANPTAPPQSIQADDKEEAPEALNDVMAQLIAQALACDLTDCFSYAFTLPAGHVYYRHLGPEFDRSFHEDIVHLVDTLPNGYGMVTQGVVYTMQNLARFCELMAQTPYGPDGGSLLDAMGMLVTSEVSLGWTHEMTDHPYLVMGGGGGKLAGDRHITSGTQRQGSEVLLSMANLYGAGMDKLGLAEAEATQTIGGLLA